MRSKKTQMVDQPSFFKKKTGLETSSHYFKIQNQMGYYGMGIFVSLYLIFPSIQTQIGPIIMLEQLKDSRTLQSLNNYITISEVFLYFFYFQNAYERVLIPQRKASYHIFE